MSNSVSTMRRNEGNRSRDAKMRKMARGVVSRADWYAIGKVLSVRSATVAAVKGKEHIP